MAISVLTAGSLFGALRKMKDGFRPFNLKVYGLTLVVGFTAINVLTDIPSDKLSACIGILGAVAGYLFGLKKRKLRKTAYNSTYPKGGALCFVRSVCG